MATAKRKAEDEPEQQGTSAKQARQPGILHTPVELAEPVDVGEAGKGGIACLHDVSIPEGYVRPVSERKETAPAKEYPFVLDPFQREAIQCLEAGESVLVSYNPNFCLFGALLELQTMENAMRIQHFSYSFGCSTLQCRHDHFKLFLSCKL